MYVNVLPLAAPIRKPCGPTLEQVHPGTGSFHDATTEIKKNI